jgi:hypothetical protein
MAESAEEYKARIRSHVQGRDPLALLAVAPDTLAALLDRAAGPAMFKRTAPEKWTIQEIVAHLADVELVGGYRVRMIVSKPGTPIQAFDQDIWVKTGRYSSSDPRIALQLFRHLRAANLALWQALTPEEWELTGVHAERGIESVRDVALFHAGHDLNHFAQIEAILASV